MEEREKKKKKIFKGDKPPLTRIVSRERKHNDISNDIAEGLVRPLIGAACGKYMPATLKDQIVLNYNKTNIKTSMKIQNDHTCVF